MVLGTSYLVSHLILPLLVRWASWSSFCRGGSSGSESYLLKFTPVGDDRVRIWFPVCLMPRFLLYFLLVWITVFFVISQWPIFLSITRLYSSLNYYIKNIVLESRVSISVHHNLNFKVVCCISSPILNFLSDRHPLLVLCALPSSSVWDTAKCSGCLHFGNGFSWRLSLLTFWVRMVQSVTCVVCVCVCDTAGDFPFTAITTCSEH